jgi:hypothetical protein
VQRCPKCGYREKYDWPAILSVIAFCVLYVGFGGMEEHVSRNNRLVGLGAFLLFLAASAWGMLRNEKNRREYLKSQGVSLKLPSL